MSVTPIEPAPTEPQAGTPTAATPATPPAPAVADKPWGDDANFDADKAWKLIEALKADKEKLSAREFLSDQQKADLAELDRLKEASKTDLERAQEAANRAAERIATMTQRAVASEVKALAADKFADPSDASAFLDLGKYANEGGDIDTAAINADLAALLNNKPHLGKPAGTAIPQPPKPNPAQGSSASGTPSAGDQAAQAAASGNWRESIRLKSQQLVEASEQGD